MTAPKKKKITLDTLADTVATLADVVTKGFAQTKQDNNDLAVNMDQGFAKAHSRMDEGFAKTKKDNEDLALMVAKGFEEVNGKFEEMRQESDKKFMRIESGLGDVQSKLANVAYNIDLQRVEKRAQHLEDIVLARRKK